eukprot:1144867-Pelagomonas_calceolata.AAC.13
MAVCELASQDGCMAGHACLSIHNSAAGTTRLLPYFFGCDGCRFVVVADWYVRCLGRGIGGGLPDKACKGPAGCLAVPFLTSTRSECPVHVCMPLLLAPCRSHRKGKARLR